MKLTILLSALSLFYLASAVDYPFYETCRNFRLVNSRQSNGDNWWTVFADCRNVHAGVTYPDVYVNLNHCFTNNNGNLQPRNGGWMSPSCNNCVVEANSAWLNCECRRANGVYQRTRVDMHRTIYNIGGWGNLACKF